MTTRLAVFFVRAMARLDVSSAAADQQRAFSTGMAAAAAAAAGKKPHTTAPPEDARSKIQAAVDAILAAERGGKLTRPLTPLQLYMREMRQQKPKKKSGDAKLKAGEIFQIRREEFEQLSEGRRKKFIKEAKKEHDRYLEEKKKLPAPEKLKRALSPYNCFVKERFSTRPAGVTAPQFMASLGVEFKNLPDQERAKYVQLSKKDEERVKRIRATLPPVPPKVKSRPPSAYNLYVRDKMETRASGEKPRDVMQRLSGEWQALDPQAKQKYQDEAGPPKPAHVRTRALSPYNIYVREGMANRPEGELAKDMMKTLAGQWKSLGLTDKKRFEGLSAKDELTHPKKFKKDETKKTTA